MKEQYSFMRKTILKSCWILFYLLCFVSLVSSPIQAQAPNQFSFQGVARDASGKVIANGNVTVWIGIKSSPEAVPLFQEYHEVSTNGNGIFTIQIGSKGGGLANLANIDWNAGPNFLNILINPLGGYEYDAFIDLGLTQLLSVPYALMANVAAKLPELDPISQIGAFGQGKMLNSFSTAPSLVWYPRKDAFKVGMGVTNENSFGEHSVALGYYSIASANYSTALGDHTIANVIHGTVLGRYNDIPLMDFEGNQDERLLQIGNGTSNENRTNALTMMKDGKIGIGTNVLNPKYLLDIGGRARIKHTNETAGIHFNNSANIESSFVGMKTDDQVGLFIGGNWSFYVNGAGEGYLNGAIMQTSDRRLKRDFAPLSNSLSKLTNITGQHYFWKDSSKSQALQTGLIAQEVEQYFPELVTTDEKGFKAVNYIGLIPHLIESVKALKAQTETIGALEKQMQELRAEVKNMKIETVNHSNLKSK